jgi:ribosomal protein S18 acetylase RimI-like enzyme
MGSNHRTAWVAEIDGKVVGFAIISDKGDRAYVKLSSIAVAKGMRKRGVGERLLQTCLDYAMSTSHGRMILTVTEDNRLTKEFFVHHGFKLIGRIGNKYRPRKDEYVYERKLR